MIEIAHILKIFSILISILFSIDANFGVINK